MFDVARQKQGAIETQLDPSATEYGESSQLAIKNYEECLAIISRLSLFSSNETLDEVVTTHLRYGSLESLR